jgi:alkylation response protein AidB-like acyl-CoA dehydrogenase
MDVRLSPEQQALRDSVAHAVDRLAPGAVADLEDPERADKLDATVAAAEWRELRTPSPDGTPVASGVEAAIIAEELARGLADTAFLGPTLAADLRRLAGVPVASRRETVVLAADLADLATSTIGSIAIDASGAVCGLVSDDGTVGSVELAGTPVRVDLTRSSVPIGDRAEVTYLDSGRLGEDELSRWRALGLALGAADLVGIMRGAIDLACEHATTRRQFGAPVGSFQAVQHLLADAMVAMEGSRSVALHAAWSVDALEPADALAAASLAKAYCARSALAVCETAIQVHGGIGQTWECLAHVYLRRALLSIDLLGGVGPNLARVLAHRGIGGTHGIR